MNNPKDAIINQDMAFDIGASRSCLADVLIQSQETVYKNESNDDLIKHLKDYSKQMTVDDLKQINNLIGGD